MRSRFFHHRRWSPCWQLFPRLWTHRMRWRLWLAVLCLAVLTCVPADVPVRAQEPAQSPIHIDLIRYTTATDGTILLTYGVESDRYPLVDVSGGEAGAAVVSNGAGGYRARVNASLDPCRGYLAITTIDNPRWQVVMQRWCVYIPTGAKP